MKPFCFFPVFQRQALAQAHPFVRTFDTLRQEGYVLDLKEDDESKGTCKVQKSELVDPLIDQKTHL